jgi:CHAD domain-containing protein
MRVATRRLRAAIALFSDLLPARVRALRRRLGVVGSRLGEVRDLDVQLEQLAEWTETLDSDDRTALQGIARLLSHRRERARVRMLRLLDSTGFERLQSSMAGLLRQGPSRRSPAARARILDVAPVLIARRYRKVRKAGDALTPDSPPAAYHVLRIQCKRLRYALEFHADLYGEVVRSMIERLVVLQDLLGEHQDAQVAMAHIGELCAGARPRLAPRAMFVLGRVAERYSRNAADLRADFFKAYRRIRGRRFRPLLESIDQRRLEVLP